MDTVYYWMSAPAITVNDLTTLPAARALLASRRIRRLPVLGPDGRLAGIVTEGDINRISSSPDGDLAEYNLYYRVRDLPLRECMHRPVVTVTPDTPLQEAAQLMLTWRVHGLPVVQNEQVVGMISVSDMLRHVLGRPRDTNSVVRPASVTV